jgi:transcriptional regulator with XRE-family HTH domain
MQLNSHAQLVFEDGAYNADMAGRPPITPAPLFGQRLATLRKARGMTQPQFAELVGVSLPMLIYYERRAKNPSADFIKSAAKALAVSVDELLGFEPVRQHKPGPPPKFQKLIEQVSDLPRNKQKFVVELLESYLGNGQKQAA